ncbi:ensconsin-like isoform X1 [Ptychodera flava]|uniref:ensconsin-like isoform X1 n=2 Tax=Ptychodera flava TaxID=63121 RepID=UPI00396A10AF
MIAYMNASLSLGTDNKATGLNQSVVCQRRQRAVWEATCLKPNHQSVHTGLFASSPDASQEMASEETSPEMSASESASVPQDSGVHSPEGAVISADPDSSVSSSMDPSNDTSTASGKDSLGSPSKSSTSTSSPKHTPRPGLSDQALRDKIEQQNVVRDQQIADKKRKQEAMKTSNMSHRQAVEERRRLLEQQDKERKEAILRRSHQRSESAKEAREKRRSWTPGFSYVGENERRHSSEQIPPEKSHSTPTFSSPTKRLSTSVSNVAASGSSMSKRLSMSSSALNRARTPSPIHLVRLRGGDPDELYPVYDTSASSELKRGSRLSNSSTSTGGVDKPMGFASSTTSTTPRSVTPRPKRWRASSSQLKIAKSIKETESTRAYSSHADLTVPRPTNQLRSRSLDRRIPPSKSHENIARKSYPAGHLSSSYSHHYGNLLIKISNSTGLRPLSPGTFVASSTPKSTKPASPRAPSPGQTPKTSRTQRAHSADRALHTTSDTGVKPSRPAHLAVGKNGTPPIKKPITPAATERKPGTPSPSKTLASVSAKTPATKTPAAKTPRKLPSTETASRPVSATKPTTPRKISTETPPRPSSATRQTTNVTTKTTVTKTTVTKAKPATKDDKAAESKENKAEKPKAKATEKPKEKTEKVTDKGKEKPSEKTNGEASEKEASQAPAKAGYTDEERAKAALAERRRLVKEQAEREAELERQRQEELRRQEEERRRQEEEEQRRLEEEAMRLAEEHRKAEEERLKKAIEEKERREREEREQAEEEARQKVEAEKRAKEEAERRQRELEEKLKKEEEERDARRKRIEQIMKRTRRGGNKEEEKPAEKKEEEVKEEPALTKQPSEEEKAEEEKTKEEEAEPATETNSVANSDEAAKSESDVNSAVNAESESEDKVESHENGKEEEAQPAEPGEEKPTENEAEEEEGVKSEGESKTLDEDKDIDTSENHKFVTRETVEETSSETVIVTKIVSEEHSFSSSITEGVSSETGLKDEDSPGVDQGEGQGESEISDQQGEVQPTANGNADTVTIETSLQEKSADHLGDAFTTESFRSNHLDQDMEQLIANQKTITSEENTGDTTPSPVRARTHHLVRARIVASTATAFARLHEKSFKGDGGDSLEATDTRKLAHSDLSVRGSSSNQPTIPYLSSIAKYECRETVPASDVNIDSAEDKIWQKVEKIMRDQQGEVEQKLGINEGDDDSEGEEGKLWNIVQRESDTEADWV